MSIPTEDPTTFIVDGGPDWKVYENTDGRRWVIRGTCVACGVCEQPGDERRIWTGKPIGEPGACLDPTYELRRDVPITPDGVAKCKPYCTLTGEWLDADPTLPS